MNLALDTELVENFVFSEIKLGQSARLLRNGRHFGFCRSVRRYQPGSP